MNADANSALAAALKDAAVASLKEASTQIEKGVFVHVEDLLDSVKGYIRILQQVAQRK